jgi:hypothetical protein
MGQESCDFPLADFTAAPYIDAPADQIVLVYQDTEIPVTDFLLQGTFSADGTRFGGGILSGLADSRGAGDLLKQPGNEDALCDLAAGVGIQCEPCPDGQVYCLYLRAVDPTATAAGARAGAEQLMLGAVRHLVALFVAVHLFAITLCALPSVGSGMNRSAWKQPTVQGEFQAWTEKFNRLGWAVTEPELEDRLWAFASGYEGVRAKVLAPFEPYFDYCGTWQSWKMFVAPHRFPAKMQIEIDRGAGWGWSTRAAAAARLDGGLLHHDRFRAALFRYEWEHYKTARREFVDWVAMRAAEVYAEASRARVSFLRYRSPSAQEVRAGVVPATKRELAQTRELAALR